MTQRSPRSTQPPAPGRWPHAVLPALALAFLGAGCSKEKPAPAAPTQAASTAKAPSKTEPLEKEPAQTEPSKSPAAGVPQPTNTPPLGSKAEGAAGMLEGTVYFDGPAPERKPIAVASLPGCNHEGELLTEQYVVQDGRLANAFVYVKKLPSNVLVPPVPSAPVVLDQKGCQYVPHVVGVRVGQTLLVKNSDATNHNVKVDPRTAKNSDKLSMNKIQPPNAAPFELVFEQAEVLVPFGCTLHPHMHAHVGVVEHPFFAISNAQGTFQIQGLPAGTYELEIVHEQAGKRTLSVELGASTPQSVEVHFGKR